MLIFVASSKKRNETIIETLEKEIVVDEKIEETSAELPINETVFRQEDFEEDFEEEVATDGALNKIKKWISNFI